MLHNYEQKLASLMNAYEVAKQEKDYCLMIQRGREYYELLRRGEMTEADKEVLQNDILITSSKKND